MNAAAARPAGERRQRCPLHHTPPAPSPQPSPRRERGRRPGANPREADAMHDAELDQLCINTMRFLAIDQVEQAKSGHPGAPMGAATMAYVLWDRFLKHDPRDPAWPDRDRFVLSPGHASAMLYALLHLTGYDVSLDDLRQLPSMGEPDAGPPRAWPHTRRRGDHRPPRPGLRQRRRHGHRRAAARPALQPRRPPAHRPLHLRHRLRRRPAGRRRLRGGVAGGNAQAR